MQESEAPATFIILFSPSLLSRNDNPQSTGGSDPNTDHVESGFRPPPELEPIVADLLIFFLVHVSDVSISNILKNESQSTNKVGYAQDGSN